MTIEEWQASLQAQLQAQRTLADSLATVWVHLRHDYSATGPQRQAQPGQP
jgi:hypothetical protein